MFPSSKILSGLRVRVAVVITSVVVAKGSTTSHGEDLLALHSLLQDVSLLDDSLPGDVRRDSAHDVDVTLQLLLNGNGLRALPGDEEGTATTKYPDCALVGDAGSSGTRLYLMFNTPSPKVVTLAKYNGGLAEIGEGHPLGGHAERTASFFVEKIKEALVPPSPVCTDKHCGKINQFCSANRTFPLGIFATAGMRLIPSLVQQKLFQVVRDRFESGLREAKLPVAVEDLRVISGSEEGFWGFVAAAVLTKKAKLDANGELVVVRGIKEGLLARPPTLPPFLEMGGASVQVAVLRSPVQRTLKEKDVFVHSILGWGVNEFVKTYRIHQEHSQQQEQGAVFVSGPGLARRRRAPLIEPESPGGRAGDHDPSFGNDRGAVIENRTNPCTWGAEALPEGAASDDRDTRAPKFSGHLCRGHLTQFMFRHNKQEFRRLKKSLKLLLERRSEDEEPVVLVSFFYYLSVFLRWALWEDGGAVKGAVGALPGLQMDVVDPRTGPEDATDNNTLASPMSFGRDQKNRLVDGDDRIFATLDELEQAADRLCGMSLSTLERRHVRNTRNGGFDSSLNTASGVLRTADIADKCLQANYVVAFLRNVIGLSGFSQLGFTSRVNFTDVEWPVGGYLLELVQERVSGENTKNNKDTCCDSSTEAMAADDLDDRSTEADSEEGSDPEDHWTPSTTQVGEEDTTTSGGVVVLTDGLAAEGVLRSGGSGGGAEDPKRSGSPPHSPRSQRNEASGEEKLPWWRWSNWSLTTRCVVVLFVFFLTLAAVGKAVRKCCCLAASSSTGRTGTAPVADGSGGGGRGPRVA